VEAVQAGRASDVEEARAADLYAEPVERIVDTYERPAGYDICECPCGIGEQARL
jgi:hypothetical protein